MAGNIGPTMLQTLADALDAGPSSRARAPARGLGARAVELPARRSDASGFEPTPRRCSTSPGPPRLARHDGRLRAPPRRASSARARRWSSTATTPPSMRWCRRRSRAGAEGPAAPSVVARQVVRFGLDAPQRAGRLRPGRSTTAWPGWSRAPGDEAAKRRAATSRRDPPAAADAGRRAAHPRPPQRRQRAGRAGAGDARSAARSAPMLHGLREYRGEPHRVEFVAHDRRRRRLRRQQGHQRRRDGGRARRPRRRQGAGASWSSSSAATARARTSRRWPRRWRATRARWRRSAATRRRSSASLERPACRSSATTRCEAASRWCFEQAQRRRRGAAQPGLRQPRHVPQLRAPRRGVRRRRCASWPRERWRGSRHELDRCRRRAPALQAPLTRPRVARRRSRRGSGGAPAGAGVAEAMPVRDWISVDARPAGAPARLRPAAGLGRRRAARARRW